MLRASTWMYKGDKLVVRGRINFEDHALTKRQQENEKMNMMGGMYKDEKK